MVRNRQNSVKQAHHSPESKYSGEDIVLMQLLLYGKHSAAFPEYYMYLEGYMNIDVKDTIQ
jgi:hypothetical protein